jgi:hypothetical protein
MKCSAVFGLQLGRLPCSLQHAQNVIYQGRYLTVSSPFMPQGVTNFNKHFHFKQILVHFPVEIVVTCIRQKTT